MKSYTRNPTPLEHDEQVTVVQWLEWQQIPFFAVPNGARVRPSQARKLKAEGMRAGVPDLWLPVHRIVIEMKRRDAVPSDTSPEQRAWLEKLKTAGWDVAVCHGADVAIDWLRSLGVERYGHRDERPPRAEDYMRTGESNGAAIGRGARRAPSLVRAKR
jgi:hypothetical protein